MLLIRTRDLKGAVVFGPRKYDQSRRALNSVPVPTTTPEEAAIVERIAARRAPRPLIALDLALLHSPPIADGWNSLLRAVRTQTLLPSDVLELAICTVAAANNAGYEWAAHAPLARAAGVSDAGMDAVRACRADGDVLGAVQKVTVEYALAMTRDIQVPDDVFSRVRAHFDDRQVVELTTVIATYNCVSRFLVALDVGERNGRPLEG